MHISNQNHLLLLLLIVPVLSFAAFAQVNESTTSSTNCAPPNYGCARNDLIKTNNLNPPPQIPTKNSIVTPSDFKLPIVRLTDATTFQKKSLTVTISGSNSDNIFNTNDTYVIVQDDGAWKYPVAFNPATMQVLNPGPWVPGSNQVRWGGSGSFSRVNPNVVYALPGANTLIPGIAGDSMTLYKITLSGTTSITATGSKMFSFAGCPGMPSPYASKGVWHSALTVSAGDTRFAQGFSNEPLQDTGTDVMVYDAPSGQCYHYNTGTAQMCSSSGCAPMSLPDKYKIHEAYMSLDGKYVRVTYRKCVSGGCNQGSTAHPYIWEVGTTNVTRCYASTGVANCTGHMVEGYTHLYNWTAWPTTGKRQFSDVLSYSVMNSSPDLNPITDAHYSNNAADPNDTNPIWLTNLQNVHTKFGGAGCNTSGNVYEGCTFPGPLYGEIFGIAQNGSYIRAAHSYNSGAASSSDFNCKNTIGAVSQTGKFFAWTSDWLTTLGKDETGANRCDTFIVNLAAAQGALN